MKRSETGFTLIELIIAVSVIGILAAFAYPTFRDMAQNAKYKEAARNIASALRDARSRAVAQNFEHRVELNVGGGQYRMTRGNRSSNSTNWSTVIFPWFDLAPNNIKLKSTQNCDSDNNVNFEYNPNGSGSLHYLCVMDNSSIPVKKYRISVPHPTTGRVVVQKWNPGTGTWQ